MQIHPLADKKQILELIKSEIDNDPTTVGYAGKTDADIVDLLNNTKYYVDVMDPEDESKTMRAEVAQPPRINTILIGVPFAPNIVDEACVTEARA